MATCLKFLLNNKKFQQPHEKKNYTKFQIKKDLRNLKKKMKCKTCKIECNVKRSKTDKNYDRQFYSCPNGCNLFNGWITTIVVLDNFKCNNCKSNVNRITEEQFLINKYNIQDEPKCIDQLKEQLTVALQSNEFICQVCSFHAI